jgi:hypothetical protein
MKKKLFYVVRLDLENIDGEIFETTGIKYVQVYDMVDNVPTKFCDLEIVIEDNSEEAIQEYLDDNGHGDEMFEFVEL